MSEIHPELIKVFETLGHRICERCKCCDLVFQECENCDEDGFIGHDCGEDTCCCLYPEENIVCEICHGHGGWMMCLGRCDTDGHHELIT